MAKTKLVRVTLGVLTRVEYSEVVEVPANMTDEELEELVDQRYDAVDPSQYSEDHAFWQKGESCGFELLRGKNEKPSMRVSRPRRGDDEFVVTPVEGPAEEKAWIDVQAWFNKCITAAPKPEVSQADLTIGHIIRWCQLWDISTDDIEAICEKHAAYKGIRPFANPFPL